MMTWGEMKFGVVREGEKEEWGGEAEERRMHGS